MRSNGKYDDPEYLSGWDSWLSKLDFSSSSTPAKSSVPPTIDLPHVGSRTTRTDNVEPVVTPEATKLPKQQPNTAPKTATPPKQEKQDTTPPTFQPSFSSYGKGTSADPNPRPDHGYNRAGYRRRNG